MNKLRNTIYYEFYTVDNLDVPKKMGTRVLGSTTLITGIDIIPTLTITIPLEDFPTDELANVAEGMYFEPRMQRYIIVVHFQTSAGNRDVYHDKYTFRGVIDQMNIDYANYAVQLSLSHQVARMREWAMPVNYSIKNMPLDFALSEKGAALGYPNPDTLDSNNLTMQSYNAKVNFVYKDFIEMPRLEMTFGANNKLEALSEALKNTEFAHFYIDLTNGKESTIIIRNFEQPLDQTAMSGELTFSPYPVNEDECDDIPSGNFVTMLTEPQFNVNYTNHYNRAVVFCGDIQDGVNHLTLEQIYANPALQQPGFPVRQYTYGLNLQPEPEYDEDGKKINNEKIYEEYDIIAYSKNTNREYYVEDSEQLEDDRGVVLNTTFNFNDLYPIPSLEEDIDDDGEMEELVIRDQDRVAIAEQAYLRAIRKLKSQRPQRVYQFNSTALPSGTYDAQPARLVYSKTVNVPDRECENNFTKQVILNINEKMYLTKRTIVFDAVLNEQTTVTLDKTIRPRDISAVEIALTEAISEAASGDDTRQNIGSTNYDFPVKAIDPDSLAPSDLVENMDVCFVMPSKNSPSMKNKVSGQGLRPPAGAGVQTGPLVPNYGKDNPFTGGPSSPLLP